MLQTKVGKFLLNTSLTYSSTYFKVTIYFSSHH